ncbi:hypothetical protein [Myceligenerans indicum]|uniref:Uncharacterized protein n=1 Tax=Myceligenerans indicum TaxID=2593663 RepID=A0ABS1LKV6_9MICO|nr:hypothetical protein [Myceligenerans indicum]MBL0886890.1 hypothetical protein [Myceligenerans indicum]
MTEIEVDFSRPLTGKQRQALSKRLARLESEVMSESVEGARNAFKLMAGRELRRPLRVRSGFAYWADAPESRTVSDRSAPPKKDRPPATRIVSPRGVALRFVLTMIALQQARHSKAGSRATNDVPIRPTSGRDHGWADLIASATPHADGLMYHTPLDKKVRHVQSALNALSGAHLVELEPGGKRPTYNGFRLLDECAGLNRPGSTLLPYTTPDREDSCLALPAAFINEGWIHVLEDSEIALLLMVACGIGNLEPGPQVAIPSRVRLLKYGIGRDSYSTAHPMLARFGLLEVEEIGRRDDGRVLQYGGDDGEAHVHRLQLMNDAFEGPALETVTNAIKDALDRS